MRNFSLRKYLEGDKKSASLSEEEVKFFIRQIVDIKMEVLRLKYSMGWLEEAPDEKIEADMVETLVRIWRNQFGN